MARGQVLGGLVVLASMLAWGQPAFVQQNFTTNRGSSQTLTFPLPSSRGNTIVVATGYQGGLPAVTDSAANAYSLAIQTNGTGTLAGWGCALFYAGGIDAGAAPIAVTLTSPGQASMPAIVEYRGLDPVSCLDAATGYGSTSASTQLDSGVLQTSGPNELLVGWACTSGAATGEAGFTRQLQFGTQLLEEKVAVVDGPYSAGGAVTQPNWFMQLAAFRPSAVDGGSNDGGQNGDGGSPTERAGSLNLRVASGCASAPGALISSPWLMLIVLWSRAQRARP